MDATTGEITAVNWKRHNMVQLCKHSQNWPQYTVPIYSVHVLHVPSHSPSAPNLDQERTREQTWFAFEHITRQIWVWLSSTTPPCPPPFTQKDLDLTYISIDQVCKQSPLNFRFSKTQESVGKCLVGLTVQYQWLNILCWNICYGTCRWLVGDLGRCTT
jgi:hypothetical protein